MLEQIFATLSWFYVTLRKKKCRILFQVFAQVDYLSIQSYTFGRPPDPLLIYKNTHYDTKLTFINVIVVLVNFNFSLFKIFKDIQSNGRVIRVLFFKQSK